MRYHLKVTRRYFPESESGESELVFQQTDGNCTPIGEEVVVPDSTLASDVRIRYTETGLWLVTTNPEHRYFT